MDGLTAPLTLVRRLPSVARLRPEVCRLAGSRKLPYLVKCEVAYRQKWLNTKSANGQKWRYVTRQGRGTCVPKRQNEIRIALVGKVSDLHRDSVGRGVDMGLSYCAVISPVVGPTRPGQATDVRRTRAFVGRCTGSRCARASPRSGEAACACARATRRSAGRSPPRRTPIYGVLDKSPKRLQDKFNQLAAKVLV